MRSWTSQCMLYPCGCHESWHLLEVNSPTLSLRYYASTLLTRIALAQSAVSCMVLPKPFCKERGLKHEKGFLEDADWLLVCGRKALADWAQAAVLHTGDQTVTSIDWAPGRSRLLHACACSSGTQHVRPACCTCAQVYGAHCCSNICWRTYLEFERQST